MKKWLFVQSFSQYGIPLLLKLSQNEFYWIQWIIRKYKKGMVTKGITHKATNALPVVVHFHYYLWVDIYCQSPHWRDTIPDIVMEISFLPIDLGLYLLSDIESLITILPWNIVSVHCIQQKSFWETQLLSISDAMKVLLKD